jgi:hypothetical protein
VWERGGRSSDAPCCGVIIMETPRRSGRGGGGPLTAIAERGSARSAAFAANAPPEAARTQQNANSKFTLFFFLKRERGERLWLNMRLDWLDWCLH